LMSPAGTAVGPVRSTSAGFWPGGWVAPAGLGHVAVGFPLAKPTPAGGSTPGNPSSTHSYPLRRPHPGRQLTMKPSRPVTQRTGQCRGGCAHTGRSACEALASCTRCADLAHASPVSVPSFCRWVCAAGRGTEGVRRSRWHETWHARGGSHESGCRQRCLCRSLCRTPAAG
jgi:hypothetical protein